MTPFIVIVTSIVAVYLLRRNFRRAAYIFWTNEENPDWEAIYQRWYEEKWLELFLKDGKKPKSPPVEAVKE
jgi:hypothetical protein